jgi:hypothetical protein
MMDNCSLDTNLVRTIQDDLNYYVDNNEDPDFFENEMMYDDLDLEEVQSTVFPATGRCVCVCRGGEVDRQPIKGEGLHDGQGATNKGEGA